MKPFPIKAEAAQETGARRGLPAEFGVVVVLLVVLGYFSFINPNFRSYENVRLVAKQAAELAVIGAGMTLVIATGGIDISVGSLLALCSMTLAQLSVTAGWSIPAACIAAILTGSGCGLLNGILIAKWKLPPIVVTLATMAAAHAGATLFNGGNSISGLPLQFYKGVYESDILHLPVLLWVGAVTLIAGSIVLNRTAFGRYVLALGGNREAARLSGNSIVRIETAVYVISGALAGLAAVINTAHKATATPEDGKFLELTAITAVVLGGTVITGGKATMTGTALGVITIGALMNGVRLIGQEDRTAWFLIGAALLLAVEVQKGRQTKRK